MARPFPQTNRKTIEFLFRPVYIRDPLDPDPSPPLPSRNDTKHNIYVRAIEFVRPNKGTKKKREREREKEETGREKKIKRNNIS